MTRPPILRDPLLFEVTDIGEARPIIIGTPLRVVRPIAFVGPTPVRFGGVR